MFAGSFEACGKIIPVSYVQQAQNARKSRENQIRTFLEHVSDAILDHDSNRNDSNTKLGAVLRCLLKMFVPKSFK